MKKDVRNFVDSQYFDTLVSVSLLNPKQLRTPANFIGHCCLIEKNIPPSFQDHDLDAPATIHSPSSSNLPATLSGCIYFPEFDLFIDSPFDAMDIHAVGAEHNMVPSSYSPSKRRKTTRARTKKMVRDEYLPARWHGVISHKFATDNAAHSPSPNGPIPPDWNLVYLRDFKIKSPHNQSRTEKVCDHFLQ